MQRFLARDARLNRTPVSLPMNRHRLMLVTRQRRRDFRPKARLGDQPAVSSKHDVVFAVSAETRMHGGPADRDASGARLVPSPDGEIM